MKRIVHKCLGGTNIQKFENIYNNVPLHKVLDNATVYVAGENDEYILLVSDEWESRFTEVGEYQREKVDK